MSQECGSPIQSPPVTQVSWHTSFILVFVRVGFFVCFFVFLLMVYNGGQVHLLRLDAFPLLIRTAVLTYTVGCSTPVGAQRIETPVPADCWTGARTDRALLLQLPARPCNCRQRQPAEEGSCRADLAAAGILGKRTALVGSEHPELEGIYEDRWVQLVES